MTTRIAAVTDDQQTICPHFGRAAYYAVFAIQGGEILHREFRHKVGHREFAGSHEHHTHRHDQALGADRDHADGGRTGRGHADDTHPGHGDRGPVADDAQPGHGDRRPVADDAQPGHGDRGPVAADHNRADADHDVKHARMVEAIADCDVVLVGGMGAGARRAFADAGIRAVAAAATDIDDAVRAYLGGAAQAEPDCCR